MRDRTGKSARIAEKIKKKIGVDVVAKPVENIEPIQKKVEEVKKVSEKETLEKAKADSKRK